VSVTHLRQRLAQLLVDAPPDAPAVAYEGTWWTWGEIRRIADEASARVAELGLGAAGRVGVILDNTPQDIAVVVGILVSGRCVTTLSPLQPPERLGADIRSSELAVVIGSADALARAGIRAAVRASGRELVLGADGALTPGADGVRPPTAASYAAPQTAIEMLTSGTTGPPKRVRLTDGQLDVSLTSAHIRARTVDGKAVLGKGVSVIATPLVHIGGLWNALAGLYAGRRVVLLDRFRLDEWVSAVETYRPRAAGLVPAAMRSVLDAGIEEHRLSSLQVVTSGTAYCPPDLATAFTERYGIRVLMTYGATEFAGAVAGWTLHDHEGWWERKKGSVGRAYPGVHLRIVDDDSGDVLPAGERGVLEIRTKQAANAGVDWIRTSDLAHLDDDGFLWIDGRADDAIVRGGFKVHPETVKRVLEQHPSVLDAAVAGVPDARLGAVPVAAVELRKGAAIPSPNELEALCRQHLTPYEVPVEIKVVAALPRGVSMKVSRVDLLEMFARETPTSAAPRSA
jgi:long-chain acyl-CoA synthetase